MVAEADAAARMTAPLPTARPGFDIRLATDADRPEILALIGEMIPGCDVEARWNWLYETNPGGRALTWIASEGGEVAGCTSFFPFRMWLDGAEVRARSVATATCAPRSAAAGSAGCSTMRRGARCRRTASAACTARPAR